MTVVRVLVSCPSDVAPSVAVIQEILEEFNRLVGPSMGVRLEITYWRDEAWPSRATDPQAVLNEELGNEFDIYIGVFWARIGTPTPRAASGAIEEFERARTSARGTSTMMYFKTGPVAPGSIDIDQLRRLREFKDSLSEKGVLYWEYADEEELRAVLGGHVANEVRMRLSSGSPSLSTPISTDTPEGVLALFAIAKELIRMGDEEGRRLNTCHYAIGETLGRHSTAGKERSRVLNEAIGRNPPDEEEIGRAMSRLNGELAAEAEEFEGLSARIAGQYRAAITPYAELAMLWAALPIGAGGDVAASMQTLIDAVSGFISAVALVVQASSEFASETLVVPGAIRYRAALQALASTLAAERSMLAQVRDSFADLKGAP